ncbi:hypothetical protein SARC_04398 [Sphaeroforma arctica JP610]|uniref:Phosphatidylinositol-specific phospholipase C X domain-containing protein n=1 Tax=Sphaeroforma arctica JP610 TaxID=667725 RepID=A0A0L0G3C7_9EUKA|nr:hypothetical protein SARC_04398 [Sphaeroforma arctica JP610]KNC83346.1 hypothetical protein SARC_04398 [Sphaeroforma arctica JP610]|eukprot:XP_014157248.1 hypothetical protein SARC_04398 [Sphaeroforma arctica JP610]
MFTVAKGSLFALLAAAGSFGSDPLDGNINVQDTDIRLNELQFLGTHNSYHVAPKSRLLTLYRALESASGSDASVDAWEYTHHTLDYQMQNQNVRHFELDVYYDSVGEKFANPKALALVKDDFRLPGMQNYGPQCSTK